MIDWTKPRKPTTGPQGAKLQKHEVRNGWFMRIVYADTAQVQNGEVQTYKDADGKEPGKKYPLGRLKK